MRRIADWLIPELRVIEEQERLVQYQTLNTAWAGTAMLAVVLTLVEMGLGLVFTDGVRTVLRPVAFSIVTLSCTALVMRATYRQSGKFFREQALLNQALAHQALFDGLTDLPNRRQFHERLQRSADGSRISDDAGFSLLVIDLDGFKDVNDTLGHAVGDLLLHETARRLQSALRPQDMVARVGGDEFVALLASQQEESAVQVAMRILETVAAPLLLDGRQVRVNASIGIVFCPTHGSTGDLLLRRGDLAMYAAKRIGGTYAVYSPELEAAEYPAAA